MKFNETLIARRKQLGMTQDDLSERLDVSRQSISKWENGECMPESDKLIKLADILAISLDELTGRKKSESPAQGAPQITQAAPAPDKKSGLIRRIVTAAAALVIGALCFLAGRYLLPNVPSQETKLPDELTVSGVTMNLVSSENGKYPEIEIRFVSNYAYTGEEGVTCTAHFHSAYDGSVSAPAEYEGGTYRVRISADIYKAFQSVVFTVKSVDSEKSALIAKQLFINGAYGFQWMNVAGEIFDVN
ncbi:MAG: helix-turn-helix transcriptional regulator [Clostridia bacterium]|nr:helix-turn-helix transcriptional regulator [Clostridia bacterium]